MCLWFLLYSPINLKVLKNIKVMSWIVFISFLTIKVIHDYCGCWKVPQCIKKKKVTLNPFVQESSNVLILSITQVISTHCCTFCVHIVTNLGELCERLRLGASRLSPSAGESEAGWSQVQRQSGPLARPCLRNKTATEWNLRMEAQYHDTSAWRLYQEDCWLFPASLAHEFKLPTFV